MNVLSFRNFENAYYMDVAFDAENAMAEVLGNKVRSPNLALREYLLHRNRIVRNASRWLGLNQPNAFIGCGKDIFLFLMWCDKRIFPLMRDPSIRKSVYIFDSWEPDWNNMAEEMRHWKNIGAIYFSSSQAVRHFKETLPYPVRWCPQATTIPVQISLSENFIPPKPIVLNIGRPNKLLSDFFRKFCESHNMRYISQDSVEGIVFSTRGEFLKALMMSSIVVVHPRNIDAPDITGCVSMLTSRYFEAYHSGGVVCGFKPSSGEFQCVLGDFPFVEFGASEKFEFELLQALNNRAPWLKARENIRIGHSWRNRADSIISGVDCLDAQNLSTLVF